MGCRADDDEDICRGLLGCDVIRSCRWLRTFRSNTGNHLQDGMASHSKRSQPTLLTFKKQQNQCKLFLRPNNGAHSDSSTVFLEVQIFRITDNFIDV
jgi:hypothetical protein